MNIILPAVVPIAIGIHGGLPICLRQSGSVVLFIPSFGTHLFGIPMWIFNCVIDEAGGFSLICFIRRED